MTFANALAQVKASPIAGCVSPEEPYHQYAARTLVRWQALESMGLVQLVAQPDIYYFWDGDGPDPCPGEQAYGSIGQYRLDPDSDRWTSADSVWGHVGYRDVLDWRENPYILDIMDSTIACFQAARNYLVHHRFPTRHRS